MKRSAAPTIIVLAAALSLALSLFAGAAAAQQNTLKEQLVGTWTFISSTGKLADGSPVWGSNPKGLLIFTDNGRYSSQIVRADVPKFAAKNRFHGIPATPAVPLLWAPAFPANTRPAVTASR